MTWDLTWNLAVFTWDLNWDLAIFTWNQNLGQVCFHLDFWKYLDLGLELGLAYLYVSLGTWLCTWDLLIFVWSLILPFSAFTWYSSLFIWNLNQDLSVFRWNLGLISFSISELFVFNWDLFIFSFVWNLSVFTWNLNSPRFVLGLVCGVRVRGQDLRFTSYLYHNGLFQSFALRIHIQYIIANGRVGIYLYSWLQDLLLKLQMLNSVESLLPNPSHYF